MGARISSQTVLIVYSENLKAKRVFGERHEFKVCTEAHYLKGYIWDGDSNSNWLRQRMLTWDKNIGMISKTTRKYTQESYSAVERTIQSE